MLEPERMYEEIKRKVREVHQKQITLLMKSHLNAKNLFLALNTWAVYVIRYSVAFLDWKKEKVQERYHWT